MRFEWTDNLDIGHYRVAVYDEDKKLIEMSFVDYTGTYHQEYDKKNRFTRPYSFETRFCAGWSSSQGFDYDEDYDKHYDSDGNKLYAYQGNCTHTIADVKRFCEEFLARLFIIDYDKELQELNNRKKRSDWFIEHGYTGILEV